MSWLLRPITMVAACRRFWRCRPRRVREVAPSWPDLRLRDPRDQHVYNGLRVVAAQLMAVSLNHLPAKDRDHVEVAINLLEKEAATVVLADREDWQTAACMEETTGSFLDRFQPLMESARKRRRTEGKQKAQFFREDRRDGWTEPAAEPASQWRSQSERAKSARQVSCYICQGPHYANQCPDRKPRRGASQRTGSLSPERATSTWIFCLHRHNKPKSWWLAACTSGWLHGGESALQPWY